MAIYDTGTASLAANGQVTGSGTQWTMPLTLIRVGATLVFKTEPVQIYTISEITSDTSMAVYNPNGETVPAGTGYAILAHDGISVQGLAQDVAETLRYYQSRETEVAAAVDAFNNFDQQKFNNDIETVNNQFQQVSADAAQVSLDRSQVSADKDSAASSAASALAYKNAAAASAAEAADSAASLDTSNLLRVDRNLSDLSDKSIARNNLDVYSKDEVDSVSQYSYPNIRGNVQVPATGYIFQPYNRYYGDHDIRYIGGGIPKSTKRFKKDGHDTVTLTGISTSASNPPSVTVDTVAYVNPASADPDDTTFPASITLNGLSFVGDDDDTGEVGLTILQGQNFQIQDCGFSKTKLATWFVDVWMTSISNSTFFGQVRHDGGTSCFYTNCYATVHDASVPLGAYRISSIQYGNMTSCASDGTVNGAYWFNGNNGLTVNNCGSEHPTTMDRNYGTAAHFEKSNEMVLTNFYTLPAEGTNILVSVKDDNELVFNNMIVYGTIDKYSRDFWFTGTNNNLIINGGIFGTRGNFPRIATDQAGNTVVYNAVNGNSYIWKTKGAGINAVWEPKYLSQVLDDTSQVVFSGTGAVGGTHDIKLTKNGNIATIEFDINIASLSGASGNLVINSLPYNAAQKASGSVALAFGLNTGVGGISCAISRGSNELRFYKNTGTSGVSSALNSLDLTDGASLRGSITYSIVSDWD